MSFIKEPRNAFFMFVFTIIYRVSHSDGIKIPRLDKKKPLITTFIKVYVAFGLCFRADQLS